MIGLCVAGLGLAGCAAPAEPESGGPSLRTLAFWQETERLGVMDGTCDLGSEETFVRVVVEQNVVPDDETAREYAAYGATVCDW